MSRAGRRRHHLPGVPRPARAVADRQGTAGRAARRRRPRPARLHPRPAPHGGRRTHGRRGRDGDAAGALGRGARGVAHRRARRAGRGGDTVLVVPAPSGEPFRQATARELAAGEWLVVACGRYEGIDERVLVDARPRHAGAPDQPRRLRAERWRGGGAGRRRGRRPAAARGTRQRREPGRRRVTRAGCSSTPSTPGRRRGAGSTSRPFSCPGTTARFAGGAATSSCAGRPGAVRTWSPRSIPPPSIRGTSRCSASWAGCPGRRAA